MKVPNKIFGKIAIVLILSLSFHNTALAALPVSVILDVPQHLKEFVLDTIVNGLVNAAVAGFTKSITKWAASGFEGKPAFSQNITREVKKLEGDIIEQNLNRLKINNVKLGNFLCGPFSQEINNALRLQLATQRADTTQHSQCTVDKILKEAGYTLQEFESDFNKGGWPAWVELTNNPSNNRYGAYITIQEGIWNQQAEETEKTNKELSFGSGFLSQKKPGECVQTLADFEAAANENLDATDDPDERAAIIEDIQNVQGTVDKEGCLLRGPEKNVTAGQTIQNSLNKGLGLSADRLAIADEVDEMIGAIIQGFVLKMFQGVGGLIGSTESKPGEKSLIDQIDEEGEQNKKTNNDKAKAAADKAVNDVEKVNELNNAIDKLQTELNFCLAQLATLQQTTVIVTVESESGGSSSQTKTFSSQAEAKEAECNGIKANLESKKAELKDLLVSQAEASAGEAISGSNPFQCRFKFDGQAASKDVNFYNAGPINGLEGKDAFYGKSFGISAEEKKFYGVIDFSFDVKTGNMPINNIVNFAAHERNAYYNGMEMGITPDLRRTRWDNNAYAGGPNFFDRNNTNWTEGAKYHIDVHYDAKTNTLSNKIKNLDTGNVVGDFSISGALASQDIAPPQGGFDLIFGGNDWTYSNISVHATPGGPYGAGMPGACGLPGGVPM